MIRLDNRLQTMAELIPEGKVLADIGTDHGYLPTALVLAGKFPRAIASDKNEEPAMAALRTVRAAGLSDAISVRTGDGLSSLAAGEADVISISGMGGALMREILSANLAVFQAAKALVLQPQSAAAKLRGWLYDRGWHIEAEALAEEAGHIYTMLRAVPGQAEKPVPILLAIGPCLWAEKPPLLRAHIERLLVAERRIADGMAKSEAAKASEKYRQVLSRIKALEAHLIW